MTMFTNEMLNNAVGAYINALFFVNGSEEGDQFYGCDDEADHIEWLQAVVKMRIIDFCNRNKTSIVKYLEHFNMHQLGHDLYLSEAEHGAGFWGRGLGDLGETLHNATKHNNLANRLYVDDDNKIRVD